MSTQNNSEEVKVTAAKIQLNWAELAKKYLIIIITIVFGILLTIASGGLFLQPNNLLNVVVQVTPIGLIALGMMLPIITKGIDLSVGSIAAVAAVVAASLAQIPGVASNVYNLPPLPIFVPILVGILVGGLIGFVNGAVIAKFRIAPFIATLGMMTIARGIALLYSDGKPISSLAPGFNYVGQGFFLGIPVPVWIFAVVIALMYVVLQRTRFGRHVYAVGGNEQAARVSGISIAKVQLGIYSLIGLLSGLAGVILCARVGSGVPTLATGMELDAITAAVVGGTSFNGGVGTVWGTVIGAILIGMINNGLDLMGVSPFMQLIVKGVIIIAAIIIDERKNR